MWRSFATQLPCRRPLRGDVLVAFVDGDALALEDGSIVSDPFRRTADVVELLRLRVRLLTAAASAPRLRRAGGLRPGLAA